ncbi:DUF397 domain-containing protein [Streptomyces synnematoformans]|uniref:DUF397 domain-containing protein n=1 Tax=Streptomyces synnematoformans TaxID=415721 RepID=A0ABN2YFC1_9ACTN
MTHRPSLLPAEPTERWFKSSHSGPDGNECVEVAHLAAERVGVRDSKDPSGPVLTFDRRAFADFVTAVAADRWT